MHLDPDYTYSRVRTNIRMGHTQYQLDEDVHALAEYLRTIDLSDAVILASQLGSILFGVVYLWQQGTNVFARPDDD